VIATQYWHHAIEAIHNRAFVLVVKLEQVCVITTQYWHHVIEAIQDHGFFLLVKLRLKLRRLIHRFVHVISYLFEVRRLLE
jgi:hypothetical protein